MFAYTLSICHVFGLCRTNGGGVKDSQDGKKGCCTQYKRQGVCKRDGKCEESNISLGNVKGNLTLQECTEIHDNSLTCSGEGTQCTVVPTMWDPNVLCDTMTCTCPFQDGASIDGYTISVIQDPCPKQLAWGTPQDSGPVYLCPTSSCKIKLIDATGITQYQEVNCTLQASHMHQPSRTKAK